MMKHTHLPKMVGQVSCNHEGHAQSHLSRGIRIVIE